MMGVGRITSPSALKCMTGLFVCFVVLVMSSFIFEMNGTVGRAVYRTQLSAIAGLLCYLFVFFVEKNTSMNMYLQLRQPPNVNHHWFFGPIMTEIRHLRRMPFFRLEGHGDQPKELYCMLPPLFSRVGSISLADPRDVKHILKTSFHKYIKSPLFIENFGDALGTGIFISNHGPYAPDNGRKWKLQRKMAARIFTRGNFKVFFLEAFKKEARKLCTRVFRPHVGKTVDIQQIMGNFTLSSIGEIAFGVEDLGQCTRISDGSDEDAEKDYSTPPFADAFDRVQTLCFRRFFNRFVMMLPKLLRPYVSSQEAELLKCKRVLDALCKRVIREAREMQRKGGKKWEKRKDLMALFMKESKSTGEAAFSDLDLRDVVLSFLIAGRDTTRATLTFLFKILSENPDIHQNLAREISTIGEASPTTTWESIASMRYLDGLVKETLRLYPPVWTDPKFSTEDDVLPSGARIPVDSIVHYSPFTMGRSKVFYGEDVLQVRPERWWKKRINHYEFPVFQAGPRICLGMNMACLEVKVCVVEILRSGYSFKATTPPSTQEELRFTVAPTLVLENGLNLKVIR